MNCGQTLPFSRKQDGRPCKETWDMQLPWRRELRKKATKEHLTRPPHSRFEPTNGTCWQKQLGYLPLIPGRCFLPRASSTRLATIGFSRLD